MEQPRKSGNNEVSKRFNFKKPKCLDLIEIASERKDSPAVDCDLISPNSHVSVQKKPLSFNQCMKTTFVEEALYEDKRLANWNKWLKKRNDMHERLGAALSREPPSLVMNSIEDECYIRNDKDALELARIYLQVDKYRGSPYFWQSPTLLSNRRNPSLPDCAVTLSKLERGIVEPVNYVDTPILIREEKFVHGKTQRPTAKELWCKSAYLKKVKHKLKDKLDAVESHKPDCANLVIMGKSIDKSHAKTTTTDTNKLPVLTVSGCEDFTEEDEDMSVTSTRCEDEGTVSVSLLIQKSLLYLKQTTVTSREKIYSVSVPACEGEKSFDFVFEAQVNETSSHSIIFENTGTVKFLYWWKQIRHFSKNMPISSKVSFNRFFFNKNDGVILPGQIMEMKVWFRSRTPGVFQEKWQLNLLPKLTDRNNCICFRFYGMADQVDTTTSECTKIEDYLKMCQQESTTQYFVEDICRRIRHIDPPTEKCFKTEYLDEKYFMQKNPGYYYHPSVVETLRQLYDEVVQDPRREWDFDLKCLRLYILQNTKDPVKQNDQLEIFCKNVNVLLFPCAMSSDIDAKHTAVRSILCEFVNSIDLAAEELKRHYQFMISRPQSALSSATRAERSVASSSRSLDKVPSRRQGLSDRDRTRKRSLDQRSKITLPTGRSSAVNSSPSEIKSMTATMISVDKTKYTQYREALFVKVYFHLATAMEQVSAVLESLKAVE